MFYSIPARRRRIVFRAIQFINTEPITAETEQTNYPRLPRIPVHCTALNPLCFMLNILSNRATSAWRLSPDYSNDWKET